MMADIYKTQVSGVTNYIELSKRWLEKAGHIVYIFTFGDDEVIDDEKNIIRTSGLPVVDTGIYLVSAITGVPGNCFTRWMSLMYIIHF